MKKLNNRIIQQFNSEDTFLIISDYPELSKHGEKNYGIAWYTKELLTPLAQKYNVRFVVLAEKTHLKGINASELYEDGKILVLRIFDQKHPSLFPKILKWLNVFNKIKNIHVHSEFCTNGGIKNFILLIPFLLLIKLFNKNIAYFSHNVVLELSSLAPHLGLSKKSLKTKIINFALPFYYKLLGLMVDRFVVMDEVIQKRLLKFVDSRKITLQPFWDSFPNTRLTQKSARKKLGIKNKETLIILFGLISYYKGTDWLINAFKALKKQKAFQNVKLIVAGGAHVLYKDRNYYQTYYQKILNLVKGEKDIKITGFVPEKDIPLYFKASDLVVFPYRGIIGSSACLSHAISYKKPFILSSKMKMVLENKEFRKALSEGNIETKEVIFEYNQKGLGEKILKLKNKNYLKKLKQLSSMLVQEKNKDKILSSCYYNLYAPTLSFTPCSSYSLGKV